MSNETIAFIGAGNMAQALVAGLLRSDPDRRIQAADPSAEQRQRLGDSIPSDMRHALELVDDNSAAVAGASVVVFAVKPQILRLVAVDLASHLLNDQLLISIAAGVPSTAIETWCGARPIVRAMPNTPALLGAGATALFANSHTSDAQRATAEDVLSAAGFVAWVDAEAQLDAVTAVSGSGPAYFFYLMEAMIDAGCQLGLTPDLARSLTLHTALGAARMAAEGGESPSVLRQNVTSPGGTTERALSILDADNGHELIVDALKQAAARAKELAQEFGQ